MKQIYKRIRQMSPNNNASNGDSLRIEDYMDADEITCIKAAAKKFGLGEDVGLFYSVMAAASRKRFVIDVVVHSLFHILFSEELETMKKNRSSHTTTDVSRRGKRKRTSEDKRIIEEETDVIIYNKQNTSDTLKIRIFDLVIILSHILARSNWTERVATMCHIPFAIVWVLSKRFIPLKTAFKNISQESYYFHQETCSKLVAELEETAQSIVDTQALRFFEDSLRDNKEEAAEEDNSALSDDAASETSMLDRFDERDIEKLIDGDFIFVEEPATIKFDILPLKTPCIHPNGKTFQRLKTHPYVVSAAVFATCNYSIRRSMSEERPKSDAENVFDWRDAKKLYFLCYDWINDQVRVVMLNVPLEIKCMLNAILFTITGLGEEHVEQNRAMCFTYSKCFLWYIRLFEKIPEIIKRYHISTKYFNTKGKYNGMIQKKRRSPQSIKAHLVHYDTIDQVSWHSQILSKLHPFYHTSTNRVPSMAAIREDVKHMYLRFQISTTTPLQLYYSMKRLELHIRAKKPTWSILYDADHVYMSVESEWFAKSVSTYMPYMLYSETYVSRKVPYPTYPFHLINYFNGGRQGVLQTMKFIIRTFCHTTRVTDSTNYMPSDANDVAVDGYMVFHNIISRFKSQKEIWSMLTEPLTSYLSLMVNSKYAKTRIPMLKETKYSASGRELLGQKKTPDFGRLMAELSDGSIPKVDSYSHERDRFSGLRDGTFTLYGAIRAFVYVKAQHFIHVDAIRYLDKLFTMENPMLQIKYPLVYSLISVIRDQKGGEDNDELRIPKREKDAMEEEYDNDSMPDPKSELCKFELPYQFILYYFCLSPDITDEDAVMIFTSITSKIKAKKMTSKIPFSFKNGSKMERLRPFVDMYKREASTHPKDTEDNRGVETKRANPMESLLQALEELSMYKMDLKIEDIGEEHTNYRGSIKKPEVVLPISSFEVLQDKDVTYDSVIVDTEIDRSGGVKHFRLFDSFPIFDPEIVQDETSLKTKDVLKYMKGRHLPPFFRSEGFLECVIMYPVVHVQCISTENCSIGLENVSDIMQTINTCPVDARTHILNASYEDHTQDAIIKRKFSDESINQKLEHAQKKWRYVLDDRIGWKETHPSFQDIIMGATKPEFIQTLEDAEECIFCEQNQ